MLGALESNEPRAAASEHPLIGKVVEQRYRVVSHIGSGGMADVYEVEHVALGRRLAMKVLRQTRSSNPHLARRFSREARAASRIDSEHVVAIHDYGAMPEGQPYFVMDLLRGQNLRQLLAAQASLPVVRVVNIAIDVCLGLYAAHTAGLVHRDLKPENLWLSRGDDGREVCVLLDFGVARFEGAHTTGDGVLVGTARYMSPEQIGSETAPGPASDLFSLAVIAYECLTGKAPFAADSLERTLFRILNEAPAPLVEVCPDVPSELSDVLEKSLAKRPEQRFGTALELAAALRTFAGAARPLPALDAARRPALSETTLAESDEDDVWRPPTAASGAERHARESAPDRRFPAWLGAFALGSLLGAALLYAFGPRSSDPEPNERSAPTTAMPETPTTAMPETPTTAMPETPTTAMPETPTTAMPAGPSEPVKIAPSSPSPTAAPSATPTASPVVRHRRTPVPPAPAPTPPGRPEPPQPNFDGRNPYFQ